MNYTVEGKNYIADEGYVFCRKDNGYICKMFRLSKLNSIDKYDVIPEHQDREEEADN